MKYYLHFISILLYLLVSIDICSSTGLTEQDRKLARVVQVMGEYPEPTSKMFAKAKEIGLREGIDAGQVFFFHQELIDELLAEVESAPFALRQIPIDQQQILSGVDIFNGVEFEASNIIRIDFNGIPDGTNCPDKLEPIVYKKRSLYNMSSLLLSRIWDLDSFVIRFFSNESQPFVSLYRIDVADSAGTMINGRSLESILKHFKLYPRVARDMAQRDFKTGDVAVFLNIHGVSKAVLDDFNALQPPAFEYTNGSDRLLVIKPSIDVYYRSGEPSVEGVRFIAMLNIS